ncbi:MAG: Single-strand binding protein family, partial [Pseudomonadota bacterium]
MPNFASISIIGHLGKDAEVNTTQSGMATTRFSIAFATGYGDKKATTWARCTWFGERGQKVA